MTSRPRLQVTLDANFSEHSDLELWNGSVTMITKSSTNTCA